MPRRRSFSIRKWIQDHRQTLRELAGICLLGFFFWCFNFNSVGAQYYDETFYLRMAYYWVPDPAWGSLYTIFYRTLLFVLGPLYAFNAALLLVCGFLAPCAIYMVARWLSSSRLTAFTLAIWMLLNRGNMPQFPHVQIFTFSLVLVAFIALFDLSSLKKTGVFFLLLGFFIFLRQDILATGILVLILALALGGYGWRGVLERAGVWGGAFAAGFLSLAAFFGNPFEKFRFWQAFRDHFMCTHPEFGDNVFAVTKALGSPSSIFEVIQKRPALFWLHVGKNLRDFPEGYLKGVIDKVPWTPASYWNNVAVGGIFALVLWIVAYIANARPAEQSPSPGKRKAFFILAAATAGQSLFTSLILEPFPQYFCGLLFVVPLTLICFLPTPRLKLSTKISKIMTAGVLTGFMVAAIGHNQFFAFPEDFKKDIKTLEKNFSFPDSEVVLGDPGTFFYLNPRMKVLGIAEPDITESLGRMGLKEFLKKNGITLLCYGKDFLQWQEFRTRSITQDFMNFDQHPDQYQFIPKALVENPQGYNCFQRKKT